MLDKKLYLHVGMDKTGTSAIQYFMQQNRSLLKSEGILYSETGLWNDYSHHPFAFSIFNQHGFSVKTLNSLLKEWSREISAAQSVVLSSECLFKAPLKNEYEQLESFIKEMFGVVKVIIYLRRQDYWVESRHKHSVFSGQELTLEQLSREFFSNYKQYIDRWADAYGRENVLVRPYEKDQFSGGTIFSDFLSCLNVEFSDRFTLPEKGINVSLGNEEHEFKKLCNALTPLFKKGAEINVELLEHSRVNESAGNRGFLLAAEKRKEIVERYREVNRSIAAEYLGRTDRELFLEPLNFSIAPGGYFAGLSADAIKGIARFVESRKPRLMNHLRKAVKKGLKNSDPVIAKAAETLSKAL